MSQNFIEIPSQPAIREPVAVGQVAYDLLYEFALEYGHAQLVWYSLNGTRVVEGEYTA